MTSVSHVTAMYATKRRRRNSKNVRTVCSKDSHSKTNPSKRHRERLNQELDTLASLLPFEQSVLSKLDKLSILRLSVSYLRTKSYFQAALSSSQLLAGQPSARTHQQQQQHHYQQHQFGAATGGQQQLEPPIQSQQQLYPPELRVEGDLIVQALNGFLLILTCDGEVFYTSHTVETYLGFHQSDICHQSVYELVHSEDREELMQQLKWNSMIPQATATSSLASTAASNGTNGAQQSTGNSAAAANPLLEVGVVVGEQQPQKSAAQMSLQEILASTEHRHLLERNFTVRFRCLLDNTSGFLRLDIRGRIKVLHGQQNLNNLANSAAVNNGKKQQQQQQQFAEQAASFEQREPMLAFFGVCIPFGPPSLLEMPSKDSVFKSKHRLDLSIISMDSRGKQLLGLTDLSTNYKQPQQSSTSNSASQSNCSSPAPAASNQPAAASGGGGKSAIVKLESLGATNAATNGGQPAGAMPAPTNPKANTQATKQQQNISAYDLVHHDDLSYMASAHQELLKTGASGLIAYRMIAQLEGGNKYQWLQTSAKLYYKNSKPDFILCTHRPLMEEEGRDLLGKRTMDFKVTYLDVGLSSINDRIMACDKFSSLQELGSSSGGCKGKSPPLLGGQAILGMDGVGGAGLNGVSVSSSLSPASSRSLASASPQSIAHSDALATPTKSSGAKQSRKFSYDLSNASHYADDYLEQQQSYAEQQLVRGTQQAQDGFNQLALSYDQQQLYNNHGSKRQLGAQNGDIFYDMDASANTTVCQLDEARSRKQSLATSNGTGGGGGGKKKASSKAKQAAAKKRDLQQTTIEGGPTGSVDCQLFGVMSSDIKLAKKPKSTDQHHYQQQQQSSDVMLVQHHHQHQPELAHQHHQHHHQQQQQVDQQLQLYSHYTNQHHHHMQSAAAVVAAEAADPSAAYPAIQAAAVYAAAAAHQGAYGSSAAASHATYSHHHHAGHHQSLYGSPSSMVSPSTAYATAQSHHHHHQALHSHLDSAAAAAYQSSTAAAAAAAAAGHHHHYSAFANPHHHQSAAAVQPNYGGNSAAAAAAAASFLPTEHLLAAHHYSQSARNAAALAGWPSTAATTASTADYQQQSSQHSASSHQLYQQQQTGAAGQQAVANGVRTSNGWGDSAAAAAAAAAALVASANGTSGNEQLASKRVEHQQSYSPTGRQQQDPYADQHYHQQQHLQQQSPSVGGSISPGSKQRYASTGQQHLQQQASKKASGHGPASLASDGSAHRSPLSSSESSNGSAGSLAAAQAAAAAAAAAAAMAASSSAISDGSSSTAAMISPSAYYLASEQGQQLQPSQHGQQQQQSHLHQQQQSYAHNSHYHQSPYAVAAAAQQYAAAAASSDPTASQLSAHQSHYQHQQHQQQQHHHQQQQQNQQHHNSHHHQSHHHHHQQVGSDSQSAHAAYFQHAGSDLSAAAAAAAAAAVASSGSAQSAMKLYGANGEATSHVHTDQQQQQYQQLVSHNAYSGMQADHLQPHTNGMRPAGATEDDMTASWASQGHQPVANQLVGYSGCLREPGAIKQHRQQSGRQQQYSESQQVATGGPLDSCSLVKQQQHDEMTATAGWPPDSDAKSCKQTAEAQQNNNSSKRSTLEPSRGPQEKAKGADTDNKLLIAENDAGCTEDDKRDQLAQLISSTIGDIMLDIASTKITTN